MSPETAILAALSVPLVGALLIGTINNGMNLLMISSYYQLVVKGVIIVAAALLECGHAATALDLSPPEALLEELLTSTPIPGAPEIVPVGLRSELLRRRPDVRAAERALAQASAEIGVATAEMFPKFVLAGDVAWESVDRGDWFDEDSQRWSLVPFVDWRIFEGGRLRAQVEFAEAISEEQAALFEQTVLAALADAEAALVSYGEERRTRRTLDEASAASERAAEVLEKAGAARRRLDVLQHKGIGCDREHAGHPDRPGRRQGLESLGLAL